MATREEVIEKSTEYFNGDVLAATVFADKYSLRDVNDNYLELTPDDMHRRLAKEFARIEAKYPNPLSEEEIFNSIKGFQHIVPQGSPMAAVGNSYQIQSTSNCFVIDSPKDSYGGICKTDQELVQLAKRRSGIGFSISNIRPKGANTKNAARTTDGIGIFMERFSNSCREVAQGGRRGALLMALDVRHPEIETFISIKKDKTKVTGANISVILTDDFMNAVKNNTDYEQKWPVDSDTPTISKKVNAKDIWNKIVESAWESAEPGLLFWGNVQKNTPSDAYENYKSIATNPCASGETLVYVADGRGVVSIKELADDDKDVDVFCYDNEKNVVVRKMRNPRITGYNQKILKITFDDGNFVRVTENHKFMLKDGRYVEAKDLNKYDQLQTITRYEDTLSKFFDKNSRSQKYYWIQNDNNKKLMEHRIIAEYSYGNIDGKVIHHKDFNSRNNTPDNLIPMTKKEHDDYHGECIRGDKNPMRRAQTEWSEEKWASYSSNMSKAISGLNNGRAYNFTNEEILEHAISLSKKLGRRFSTTEWEIYAKENKLPVNFSEFRQTDNYKNTYELSLYVSNLLKFENNECHATTIKTVKKMQDQGYVCSVIDGNIMVEKTCECCGNKFNVVHFRREQSFCSHQCSLKYLNSVDDVQFNRINNTRMTYKQKQDINKNKILDVYTKLKVDLGRDPLCDELHKECKSQNIPFRLYTRFGFKSYSELKESAINHNHRVVSIEFDGYENVYNGTVDDFHNFFVGAFNANDEKNSKIFINNRQCGEINLSKNDSCRLITMNLLSFVDNKYTKDAKFDFEKFEKYSYNAQRMMDDLVDLELESIDRILDKINSDPEDEETKAIEINLWKNVRRACENARRTGLGVTALGDTLAALNIKYGSKESIDMTEKFYKTLSLNAYKCTIDMARDRGSFPDFDYSVEENHEYLNRLISSLPKEYQEKYKKFGRRNIALTTTSPAGSVSLLTQTSSGIEPVFMLSYMRKTKIQNGENDKVDFVDSLGDKWRSYKVYHHELKNWMDLTGETEEEKSPWFGATAQDVDWVASVELQSSAQKWVDHSISKTCNLPNSATKELVGDVYMKAWETGCKGFTVYRDGSRDGVLTKEITPNKEEIGLIETNSPKRPEKLECDIHHLKIKGESWVVFVGLYKGKVYEVFAGLSKYVSIPKKISTGYIVKRSTKKENGSSVYDLVYGDESDPTIVKDIVTTFENPTEGTFTRLISLAIRHGSSVQHVVEQLHKEEQGDLYSFSRVLGRVLKTYIKDGTKKKGKCPNCGGENLVYQEGCLRCMDCSHSKC